MTKYIPLVVMVFVINACSNSHWDTKDLYGKWHIAEWTKKQSGQVIDHQMNFDFKENSQYELDYGNRIEEGKYWLMGDFLHTIEKDKVEKKVKVIYLSKDTFQLEMNRAGRIESVLLIR